MNVSKMLKLVDYIFLQSRNLSFFVNIFGVECLILVVFSVIIPDKNFMYNVPE